MFIWHIMPDLVVCRTPVFGIQTIQLLSSRSGYRQLQTVKISADGIDMISEKAKPAKPATKKPDMPASAIAETAQRIGKELIESENFIEMKAKNNRNGRPAMAIRFASHRPSPPNAAKMRKLKRQLMHIRNVVLVGTNSTLKRLNHDQNHNRCGGNSRHFIHQAQLFPSHRPLAAHQFFGVADHPTVIA